MHWLCVPLLAVPRPRGFLLAQHRREQGQLGPHQQQAKASSCKVTTSNAPSDKAHKRLSPFLLSFAGTHEATVVVVIADEQLESAVAMGTAMALPKAMPTTRRPWWGSMERP